MIIGNCDHLEEVFKNSHQELRNTWCDEAKEHFLYLKDDKWELNWNIAKTNYNNPNFDLFIFFVAHKIKRHIVIIDAQAKDPYFVDGDNISRGNVQNLIPILLCRIGSPKINVAEHYQTLVSDNSIFWKNYSFNKINNLQATGDTPAKNNISDPNSLETNKTQPKTKLNISSQACNNNKCKGCGEIFIRLLSHLNNNPLCDIKYTEKEKEVIKSKNIKTSQANFLLKSISNNPEKHYTAESSRKRKFRETKLKVNAAAVLEKENIKLIKHREMIKQSDPVQSKKKDSSRKKIQDKQSLKKMLQLCLKRKI